MVIHATGAPQNRSSTDSREVLVPASLYRRPGSRCYDAGAVVVGRVDVIDSRGDRGLEHADSRCPVRWRPKGVRASELHRTVPRLTSIWPSAKVDIMSDSRHESAPRAWRNDGIEISQVMST
jgi:hypothetical protein